MGARAKREIEVKLRVADADAMRRKLRRLGARVMSRVEESNTLYDTPRGTLARQGHLVRVRVERPLGKRGAARALLTLKGPSLRAPARGTGKRGGRYKVREERELSGIDPATAAAMLKRIGLRPSFVYEKRRTRYRLPGRGHVAVEFDETPVGTFLELEGPRREIDRTARRLGFSPREYLTSSYLALYLAACRRRGRRPGRAMVFRR